MRIRTVKPEFWGHPVFARQPDDVRLAAIGLLNISDDEGYFLASPALIRSSLWPFDEDSTRARRVLATLTNEGWIEVREHLSHGPIGLVVNFTKHQRIDRPSLSKIKTYFLDEDSTSIRRALDDHSLLDQGSGIRDQGSRDQGIKGSKKHKEASASPPVSEFGFVQKEKPLEVAERKEDKDIPFDADLFKDFWEGYGKKVGKSDTLKVWKRLSRVQQESAADGCKAFTAAHPDPKFRKDPVRYLRGECWEDEIPESTVCPYPDQSPDWWNWYAERPHLMAQS